MGTAAPPRSHAFWLVLTCAVVLHTVMAQAIVNARSRVQLSEVAISVSDYAAVPPRELARAQSKVTDVYSAAGIELRWTMTRPARLSRQRVDAGARQLVMLILGAGMSDRIVGPRDVVGLAPATLTASGRLAYVFYDRVRTAVPEHDNVDSLALVIAHEIGHLLLPDGAHSDTGIMRADWT